MHARVVLSSLHSNAMGYRGEAPKCCSNGSHWRSRCAFIHVHRYSRRQSCRQKRRRQCVPPWACFMSICGSTRNGCIVCQRHLPRVCTQRTKRRAGHETACVVYRAEWAALCRQYGIQIITTARSNIKHKMCKACCRLASLCVQLGAMSAQRMLAGVR
jgi:hypothetical protein